jgi:hypothetical protein
MKNVVYRDNAAGLITGICLSLGDLLALWLVFIIAKNESMPGWVWLIPIILSVVSLVLAAVFLTFLIGVKAVVSEYSLARIKFGKKTEIAKDRILEIDDVFLGRTRAYVVYPAGYDREKLLKQQSPYIDIVERAMMIQGDKDLLVFAGTMKTAELLKKFGYTITKRVD